MCQTFFFFYFYSQIYFSLIFSISVKGTVMNLITQVRNLVVILETFTANLVDFVLPNISDATRFSSTPSSLHSILITVGHLSQEPQNGL